MTLTWSGALRGGSEPNTVVGGIADSIGSYSIIITGTRTRSSPDGIESLEGVVAAAKPNATVTLPAAWVRDLLDYAQSADFALVGDPAPCPDWLLLPFEKEVT